jgi:hypothetical protein
VVGCNIDIHSTRIKRLGEYCHAEIIADKALNIKEHDILPTLDILQLRLPAVLKLHQNQHQLQYMLFVQAL